MKWYEHVAERCSENTMVLRSAVIISLGMGLYNSIQNGAPEAFIWGVTVLAHIVFLQPFLEATWSWYQGGEAA